MPDSLLPKQWADTQCLDPKAELGNPATQFISDRDAYLGANADIGRRCGADQVELFTTGDVAGTLQRELQARKPDYIALHDIGSSASLRLLASLAGAAGLRVQRLSIRRQGHGLALAVLQFVEVRRADASLMRVYSTDISAADAPRQQVARVLLAFSRLGVMMVGDLPQHALSTALHPLHQHISHSPWANRELLLVPVAGLASLTAPALHLAAETPVHVEVAPRSTKPQQVWALIAASWNRQHGASTGAGGIQADIRQAVLQQAATEVAADFLPAVAIEHKAELEAAVTAAAAAEAPQPALAAAALKTLPARPTPSALLPAQHDRQHEHQPQHQHQPHHQPLQLAMPVPGAAHWQGYADRCLGIKDVVSVCVFDIHSMKALAQVGAAPNAQRLAQRGALLLAEMADAARALGLKATPADAAISLGAHHLLLQHVAGHPGIALHVVVQASRAQMTVARVQLQRVALPG